MNTYEKDAKIFKALSDEKRLHILELLKQGEMCACELINSLVIAQSALSYHMKILCESGLVTGRQEGKWTYYSINQMRIEYIRKRLMQFTTISLENHTTC